MNFALIAQLIPLIVKYGPAVASFMETQGPQIQAFIKEVEALVGQAHAAAPAGPVLSGPNFQWGPPTSPAAPKGV